MIESIIKPKRPKGKGWTQGPPPDPQYTLGYPAASWHYPARDLFVISALEAAPQAAHDNGPFWHVSISKTGHRRCTGTEAKFVRRCFDMLDAEEDNHVPHGIVRNFFLPVTESRIGEECPCKASEPAIVEDKGDYVWRG